MIILLLPVIHYRDYDKLVEFDSELSSGITRHYMLLYKGLLDKGMTSLCLSSFDYNKRFISRTYIDNHNEFQYVNNDFNFVNGVINTLRTLSLVLFTKSIILYDPLKLKEAFVPYLFSMLFFKTRVAFITDSPEFSFSNHPLRKFFSNTMIKHSKGIIVVNKNLEKLKNSENTPILQIESFVDEMNYIIPVYYSNNRSGTLKLLYSGEISAQNGIINLILAVKNISNVNLRLYGPINNEFLDEFNGLLQPKKVEYMGTLNHKRLVEEFSKSSLLVNPRDNTHEYTVYSLPIKIPTYLASGVPVLTTFLSGIPEAYNDHMLTIPSNSVSNIQSAILKFRDLSIDDKVHMGVNARKFIIERVAYQKQGQKISDWINQL